MPDAADILEERAQLIAHAVRKVSGDVLWRWHGYDWHEDLDVTAFEDGGTLIRFWRLKDHHAQIEFNNIRPPVSSEMRRSRRYRWVGRMLLTV